jgi:hypothetical protein|tara:strand:+ start:32 stop:262 length:231 start_codon:yes stop_codon:yes gene_type:complete
MGNQASTPPASKPICESCDAQKSKAAAAKANLNSVTHTDCLALYKAVENCMDQKKGQINLCQEEWTAFRACHSSNK